MSITTLSTEEILLNLKFYYANYDIVIRENQQHMRCSFMIDKSILNVYNTGKFTIQGKGAINREYLYNNCLTSKLLDYGQCMVYLRQAYISAPIQWKSKIMELIRCMKTSQEEEEDKKKIY